MPKDPGLLRVFAMTLILSSQLLRMTNLDCEPDIMP